MLNINKISQAQACCELEGRKVTLLGFVSLPTANAEEALSKFDGALLLANTENTGVFHKRSRDFYRLFADGRKSYGVLNGMTVFATKSSEGCACYFVVNPRYFPDNPETSYATVYRREELK